MNNFLSNDRKVILKSLATGVGLISVLSLVLLIDNVFIRFLAIFPLIAIYWFVPTWFSRNNQLMIKEDKFFNIDGNEVTKKSEIEALLCPILLFVISFFLIIYVYDKPVKFLLSSFPDHKVIILGIASITSASTPYLIRHIYCFTKNCPLDTFLALPKGAIITPYNHKFNNEISPSYNKIVNPSYSYLSSNIHHQSKHHDTPKFF